MDHSTNPHRSYCWTDVALLWLVLFLGALSSFPSLWRELSCLNGDRLFKSTTHSQQRKKKYVVLFHNIWMNVLTHMSADKKLFIPLFYFYSYLSYSYYYQQRCFMLLCPDSFPKWSLTTSPFISQVWQNNPVQINNIYFPHVAHFSTVFPAVVYTYMINDLPPQL